jgi:hypothetical protein
MLARQLRWAIHKSQGVMGKNRLYMRIAEAAARGTAVVALTADCH